MSHIVQELYELRDLCNEQNKTIAELKDTIDNLQNQLLTLKSNQNKFSG